MKGRIVLFIGLFLVIASNAMANSIMLEYDLTIKCVVRGNTIIHGPDTFEVHSPVGGGLPSVSTFTVPFTNLDYPSLIDYEPSTAYYDAWLHISGNYKLTAMLDYHTFVLGAAVMWINWGTQQDYPYQHNGDIAWIVGDAGGVQFSGPPPDIIIGPDVGIDTCIITGPINASLYSFPIHGQRREDSLEFSLGMVTTMLEKPNPVPLPPSVYLFGSGLVGLIGLRRFRRS